ncbi:DUF4279 domain-containing protein [Streptosporangium longisporum]|uniref:DUF4279 domain-containing protein n=1 Tax=Streptosporangium longisporum TaxID=46187 RepID=A0ABP6KL13_9ACTN
MRISQHAYFALRSTTMTPAQITARIGLEPDEVTLRGSRSADPPRPIAYAWKIVCREPALTVDEMITRLLDRAEPFSHTIALLVQELDQEDDDCGSSAVLQVVRHLDDEDGEEEDLTSPPGFEKITGQHQLLGWHLDRRVLAFLTTTGAELDVDEYG